MVMFMSKSSVIPGTDTEAGRSHSNSDLKYEITQHYLFFVYYMQENILV